MKRTRGQGINSVSGDYERGYAEGMRAAFDDSELDAYYVGVGYGKKTAGDKHIGFNSSAEREEFKKGVRNKDEHFRAYRVEAPTFLERLFGVTESRKKFREKKKFNKNQKKLK